MKLIPQLSELQGVGSDDPHLATLEIIGGNLLEGLEDIDD